jgi:hypothetical protein
MGQIPTLVTFVAGNKIKSSEFNANNASIRDTYNVHDESANNVHGVSGDVVGTTGVQVLINKTFGAGCPQIPPIGTIIPFYDYNGSLTFNATYWAYCDGSTQVIEDIGSQTLPDLSNRYLVGFGTEGGGDIDSASWSTSVVGNASHLNSHYHYLSGLSGSFTTGTESADHNHGGNTGGVSNTHKHAVGTAATGGTFQSGGLGIMETTPRNTNDNFIWSDIASDNHTHGFTTGGRNAAHTHSGSVSFSGYVGNGSGSNGDSSFSIQPRSIRVRFIMRIK